ncbi:MAG: ABC transporter permease [Hyphomicrobiaceae bacterium]|nr:ABC transporter permease [Hyphomicrobiaceae bacterium]
MNDVGQDIARPAERSLAEAGAETRNAGRLARLRRAATASSVGTIGAAIVGFWVFCAIFAPWIAPYPPNQVDPALVADPYPSADHWLGVDHLGRDIASRLVWGARTVLTVAPVAVLGAAALGTMLGLLAGYRGGRTDAVIMRVGDTLLAFPKIILYLIVIARFGASALNIVLVITLTAAPIIARIVRAVTLDVKNRDYVAAARLRGESTFYILAYEILPNARGPLAVDFFLRLGYTIIAIGVLGFLGVGLPPPDPDWGGMVKEAYGMIFVWPHMTLIPAAAISSLVIGFNFLAAGLREAELDG